LFDELGERAHFLFPLTLCPLSRHHVGKERKVFADAYL
jgi:hypothetical protein